MKAHDYATSRTDVSFLKRDHRVLELGRGMGTAAFGLARHTRTYLWWTETWEQ
jgi:hypothetical protein